jgi:hypothetical protein
MCVDAHQPTPFFSSPLTPDGIIIPNLERGDEGGNGSIWDDVHLVMGVIIFWTPNEFRVVHAFQDICIFVKYLKD